MILNIIFYMIFANVYIVNTFFRIACTSSKTKKCNENVTSLIFYYLGVLNVAVDFRCRRTLTAGRTVSLLVAVAPAGSHLSANPAGVGALRSNQQSLQINIEL